MKASYNWLREYVKSLPQPQRLADLLTMHSFEVKSAEKTNGDWIFDIDVLPDRAHDCLSHVGIAKECAAVANLKFNIKKNKPIESKKIKTSEFIGVEVKDRDACPRYIARLIKDVKIGPSPEWLQKRLKAIGQKPINNIVDIANYVMFEIGQPLHVFDYEKLEGKKIIVRKAGSKEKIITLDGEECELDESILVICDGNDPLALAGVKGGMKAEITPKTKIIVLESANFDIRAVRNTIKKTGIKTDASLRFEHGLDPNLASEAMDRIAGLIQGIAKGEVAREAIDIYPKKVFPKKLKLDMEKVKAVIGKEILRQEAIKILKLLDFQIDDLLKVVVPTVRQDVEIEEDLIEEIARMIGYNNIPVVSPIGLLGATKTNDDLMIVNKTKSIFEGFGFIETYNFSFIGQGDVEKMGLNRGGFLELENPLSSDLKYLRKDLLVNLLKNVKDNSKIFLSGNQGIKIFEIGNTYCSSGGGKIKEGKMFCGVIAAKEEKNKGEKFYELKGAIDSFLNKLGISDQWYDDFGATSDWTDKAFWHKAQTAEIKIGNDEVGFIGEINPQILNTLGIKGTVAAFNLNFEKVSKLAQEELIYEPPSPYPAAVRDLAVFVDLEDRMADVLNTIETTGGELVRDVDLFDMYEGEGIPDGKKSMAFHIIYQSYERTLKDEEVDKIHRKIIRELEKNKNWQVRK